MARGKLKYKDVVGRKGQKGQNSKKKLSKRAPKQRKTYSLYQQGKPNRKRRFTKSFDEHEKRQRVDEPPVEHDEEEELGSVGNESDDDDDHMKQLLLTFTSKERNKQLEAIESDDSSSEEEEFREDEQIGEAENAIEQGKVQIDVEINEDETLEEKSDDELDIELADQNNEDNINDPFIKHICYDLHDQCVDNLQNTPLIVESSVLEWPCLGKLFIQIPKFQAEIKKSNPVGIQEEKHFASPGISPSRLPLLNLNSLSNVSVKQQIISNLQDTTFTALQTELFSIINNYQDLYYAQRTFKNSEDIRFIYCLHAVNHILKTRLKVVHHNVRLARKDDVPEEFRDQGLVRPKVLIVVPFKDAAYKIIQLIIKILIPVNKGHIMNRKRFIEEYTGNEISMPKKNPKPEDYEQTFTGNSSDDFRIGLTVTKKSLKLLFADFYSSDIIIASPLGLRTVIGAEGESERDFDFLASIELLILDQTDLFLMQNWDHLIHIFNHLHLQPKQSHGTNFSRVRTWSLNGWAKYYRQTLIFSSITLPEINSIFNKKCLNYAGKVKIVNEIEYGSIAQVIVQIPHVFQKFEASSAQQAIEARFEFFINKVLPKQRESFMKQTLIYVANYFDFVRLRNYFKREDISFVQICEYSKEAKVARARDIFFHGDKHFLLYTERHHFFNRIRIKGIRHVVFFQPPNFPHFYYEICNLMQESNMNKKVGNLSNMTVTVIYSKYEVHQLAAIVGTKRASKMVQSDRSVHMMVTGSE